MKTTLFLTALYLVFGFFACKKTDPNHPVAYDKFEFGKNYGLVGTKHFRIVDGYLYKGSNGEFDTVAMDASKYTMAQELVYTFPAYLQQKNGGHFGCDNCADQEMVFVSISKDGVVRSWTMDTDLSTLPVPLKQYAQRIDEIVAQL